MDGNHITTMIYNTGTISRPGITPNLLDFAWNGLGYAYEMGFMVGAEVSDIHGTTQHIISEGFSSSADGDYGVDGLKWGFLPVGGFAKSSQPNIATNTNRGSWDSSWTQWPGKYQKGKPTANLESVYGMDDFTNKEFEYLPFSGDSSKRGLGICAEVRCYQFSDANLADVFFEITDFWNVSTAKLKKMVVGLFFDPHIGGANNYADDAAQYDSTRRLAYIWDPDNVSDIPPIPPGYFGVLFVETPGNAGNGIDDDGDGMTDESPYNNIDEKDRDEVDQLGLTSFSNLSFGGVNRPKNDALMWETMKPGVFSSAMFYPPITGDGVDIVGSGYFALDTGQTTTLTIAFILAGNLDTLQQRADLVVKEYPIRFSYSPGGGTPVVERPQREPIDFSLEQNFPNPFNPGTLISYRSSVTSMVTLKVFDILGREVATLVDEEKGPGNYSVRWDATDFPSGVYFCHLKAGEFLAVRKMVVAR